MNKASLLRQKLARSEPVIVVGAHNGLSAKLVEQAGFSAVWASGFEISASYGLPDANILTMAENLAAAKIINDAVEIPVIADCDNGYGNAINVIRMVKEYEKAGIAGVCIEDNIFPKRCSFYIGVRRELETIDEFVGKIKAAKGAQESRDFVVIARTEALIAGWGMEEALKRARAYAKAGADLILIHSKSTSSKEVKDCARAWDLDIPLVCIPTIYKSASVKELQDAGFKMVIFANHMIRSAIKAMRQALTILKKEQRAEALDENIVPLQDIYDLIGISELKNNENRFIPAGAERVKAIIVAAGFERELLPLIKDKPRCMLDIKGKAILERQIETLNDCNIKNITVIRGYQKEKINLPNLKYYDNDHYEKNRDLASLFCAQDELDGPFIFLFSDIIFDQGILEKLLQCTGDINVVVDRAWRDNYRDKSVVNNYQPDLVISKGKLDSTYRFISLEEDNAVLRIGKSIDPMDADGEFVGLVMFSHKGAEVLKETYKSLLETYKEKRFQETESLEKACITDMLQELIDRGYKVSCVDVYKGWMDVDTFEDYRKAWVDVKA